MANKYYRCEETEDDNDFKAYSNFHHSTPLTNQAKSLQKLPGDVSGKQIAVEAFNFIDRGSESDFEGRMVNYDISNIIVSKEISFFLFN